MDPRRLGIPGSCDWQHLERMTKGWSTDLKYKLSTPNRGSFLLRLFSLDELPRKLDEYRVMQVLSDQGIPVNTPVDLGPLQRSEHTGS
jgi:aminoglycoside phosphotransferase (APT) family kinase protein